ncbi:predicted protein [Plenodomus lingam JN3]|uniref:Predicted protein n=1 Tax=Leptosphaeria maculans (strain JN3 / isolate v23.1.3 / race Av1-4-5-6-7-8) TaxID=985895 RepID=E5A2X2_LEPMJ|nr:predicted protein [Plenodomus lingam JN3]CBX97918.1 predicted protein [Plenodomus lingam JN3]
MCRASWPSALMHGNGEIGRFVAFTSVTVWLEQKVSFDQQLDLKAMQHSKKWDKKLKMLVPEIADAQGDCVLLRAPISPWG